MILLNLDAGEHPDEPEDLWALADLLNCACGGHAGDDELMNRVAGFCARSGVKLGAHPSYPDREGFGRRSPLEGSASPEDRPVEVAAIVGHAVAEQCRLLAEVAGRHGLGIAAVKPHGALYHDAAAHPVIAEAVLRAAVEVLGPGILVIGPARGALKDEADRLGLRYAREGFADRRVRPDGSLVPRSEPGAVIEDPGEAVACVRALAASADTICIHADTPGALAIAKTVREALG